MRREDKRGEEIDTTQWWTTLSHGMALFSFHALTGAIQQGVPTKVFPEIQTKKHIDKQGSVRAWGKRKNTKSKRTKIG